MKDTTNILVYFPKDVAQQLKSYAASAHLKVNDIVIDAVKAVLQFHDIKCVNTLQHLISSPQKALPDIPYVDVQPSVLKEKMYVGDFPAQIAIDIPQRSGADIIAGY